MQTRQQRWAQSAREQVQSYAGSAGTEEKQKYRSLARHIPSLIHDCGLAQALGFIQSKSKENSDENAGSNEHSIYLKHLQAMMEIKNPNACLDEVHEAPLPKYLRLSRDAQQAAGWLKRYSEALIEDKNENEIEAGEKNDSNTA